MSAINPRNLPFAGLTRERFACLYVVELSTGVVKIGYTERQRQRMFILSEQVKREFSAHITRFHIGRRLGDRNKREHERSLIRKVAQRAEPLPNRAEFFTGISFRAACAFVDEVSAEAVAKSVTDAQLAQEAS